MRRISLVILILALSAVSVDAQWWRFGRPKQGQPVSGGDLSSLPLIEFADLSWDGGFCVDDGAAPNEFGEWVGVSPNWSFAYDPADESIYTTSDTSTLNKRGVAKKMIPALVLSGTIASLNKATFVSGLHIVEPTEGIYTHSSNGVYTGDTVTSAETVPTGFLIWGNYLCGTFQYFYGGPDPDKPFYCRPKNMATTGSVVGMRNLTLVGTDITKRMMLAGCGLVPSQWQSVLGGPAFCMAGATFSVISTQSYGPSLATFNPDDILDGSGNAYGLIYYPSNHANLGGWDAFAEGEMMDISTQITGAAIIKDTRTTIFFGTSGSTACYGYGLTDPDDPRIGQPVDPPSTANYWCYDPANTEHGNHGYPYLYRVWLVDTMDLAAVKAGTKNPWDVVPYAFTGFEFPHEPGPSHQRRSRGLQYNDTTQKLYFAQDAVCAGSNSAIWRASITIS